MGGGGKARGERDRGWRRGGMRREKGRAEEKVVGGRRRWI